jgi:hypothetical protein
MNCPKCNYPDSVPTSKGLYTPGTRCDGCDYIETDNAVLEAQRVSSRAQSLATLSMVASLSEIFGVGNAPASSEAPPPSKFDDPVVLEAFLEMLLTKPGEVPEADMMEFIGFRSSGGLRGKKPMIIAGLARYLKGKGNKYGDILQVLAEVLAGKERDAAMMEALVGLKTPPTGEPATHLTMTPADLHDLEVRARMSRVPRALAVGLQTIGITDLDGLSQHEWRKIERCLFMIQPGHGAQGAETFGEDREPLDRSADKPRTERQLMRRRFVIAAAMALYSSTKRGRNTWSGPVGAKVIGGDENALWAIGPCVREIESEHLHTMGRMLGLVQPPAPEWLKVGAHVCGPARFTATEAGGIVGMPKDEILHGLANFLVTSVKDGMAELVCTAVADDRRAYMATLKRTHTIGEVIAHYPPSNRSFFPLGLPCDVCGVPCGDGTVVDAPCASCAKIAEEKTIARLEQQIRSRL